MVTSWHVARWRTVIFRRGEEHESIENESLADAVNCAEIADDGDVICIYDVVKCVDGHDILDLIYQWTEGVDKQTEPATLDT